MLENSRPQDPVLLRGLRRWRRERDAPPVIRRTERQHSHRQKRTAARAATFCLPLGIGLTGLCRQNDLNLRICSRSCCATLVLLEGLEDSAHKNVCLSLAPGIWSVSVGQVCSTDVTMVEST